MCSCLQIVCCGIAHNVDTYTSHNVQVSSTVPEGKGVSSSASVEVATMSAIAASHGISIIQILQS